MHPMLALLATITLIAPLASAWAHTREETTAYLTSSSLQCGDGGCPEALVWVLSPQMNPDGSFYPSVCTGTLISPDTVLTNAHCLPADMATAGASCQGKMSFLFGGTAHEAAFSAACDHVAAVSGPRVEGAYAMDFALLKLTAPVPRTPLPMGATLPLDDATLEAQVIDPPLCIHFTPLDDGCPLVGTYRTGTGEFTERTLGLPFLFSQAASVVSFAGFPIVRGNSGAPLLSGGALVAIVQERRNLAEIAATPITGRFTFSGLATSVACIADPTRASCATVNLADPAVIRTAMESMAAVAYDSTGSFTENILGRPAPAP